MPTSHGSLYSLLSEVIPELQFALLQEAAHNDTVADAARHHEGGLVVIVLNVEVQVPPLDVQK